MRLVLLTILSTIIVLSSCSSQRRIDRACKLCPHSDSVEVKTMIERFRYDSIIYVSTPPDTLRIASPCDSLGNLKSFDVTTNKKNGIKIHIKSVGNQIIAEASADSIPDTVKGLNTKVEKDVNTTTTKTIVTNDCPETFLQALYRKGFFFYLICTVIGLIVYALRYAMKIK